MWNNSLDFQLPLRFGLHFCDGSNSSAGKNGKKTDNSVENGSAENEPAKSEPVKNDSNRPVIIHRAILGSVERMTAISSKTLVMNGHSGFHHVKS